MADYTRDELMKALRAADAAGDERAARVIAGRIQSLPTQTDAKPTQTDAKPTQTDPTGGAYTYDTSGGWQAALHNLAVKMNNATRVAQDAYTYGGLDAAQSLLPGSPSAAQLRAQTNASREDLGPYTAAAIDAVARTANPLSRVGGTNPLTMAASNAAQQGVAAALHGEDPRAPAVVGGLTGGILGGLSKMPSGTIPHVVHQVKDPVLTGLGATIGGGFGAPTAGALVGSLAAKAIPAPGPVGPVTPWVARLFQGLNPGVQGILSGKFSEQSTP